MIASSWPARRLQIRVRQVAESGTPFTHSGRLYRPAQDRSLTYGDSVPLLEITKLSPTRFEENEVAVVRPPAEWSDGLHTVSAVGKKTLIDAKKKIYVFRGWRSVLRRLVAKPYLEPEQRPKSAAGIARRCSASLQQLVERASRQKFSHV